MARKAEQAGARADAVASQLCRRVKELRTVRGWSLDEMSSACGVSRSMLSQIERNQANPTLAVAFRIAEAFGMTLGELVETPSITSMIDVIRADEQGHIYRADKDCQIRTLSPLHLEKDVEFYELRLQPRGCLESAPHFEGTREFITLQTGRVRIKSGDDQTELKQGDSASYRADVPHSITNLLARESRLFLVVIYR